MKEIILDCCYHWFGVTCENQARADERIPDLLSINVPHRWLSLEPLLGSVNLHFPSKIWGMRSDGKPGCDHCCNKDGCDDSSHYYRANCPYCRGTGAAINPDWVVVGAESGPNRRECKIEWVEHIVEQCQSAGVPVFVKQLHINGKLVDDINKFPEHLRIRQIPWQAVSK